jgi:TRAP-type uncharacterized transport system fused permease subunit
MVVVTGLLGTLSLAASVQGWLLTRLPNVQRGVLFIAALALIVPGTVTDLVGFGLLTVITILQVMARRKGAPAVAS